MSRMFHRNEKILAALEVKADHAVRGPFNVYKYGEKVATFYDRETMKEYVMDKMQNLTQREQDAFRMTLSSSSIVIYCTGCHRIFK